MDHQVYLDLDYLKVAWKDKYIENINKLRKAVFETKDEVLVYNGKIIDALYFSTSNGYTENSENVFLLKFRIYVVLNQTGIGQPLPLLIAQNKLP